MSNRLDRRSVENLLRTVDRAGLLDEARMAFEQARHHESVGDLDAAQYFGGLSADADAELARRSERNR